MFIKFKDFAPPNALIVQYRKQTRGKNARNANELNNMLRELYWYSLQFASTNYSHVHTKRA